MGKKGWAASSTAGGPGSGAMIPPAPGSSGSTAYVRLLLLGYNLFQVFGLPLFGPPALLYSLARAKYRPYLAWRLGRLPRLGRAEGRHPRIWVHALSVGEVNAALPLIQAFMRRWPQGSVICSSATATGIEALERRLGGKASAVAALPFDVLPVVDLAVTRVAPDLFVFVETDLWPNWIWDLRRRGVPVCLVNGSISSRAAARLRRLGPVKDLLYGGFDVLAMQSEDDRERLLGLGFSPEKVRVLGNLKYDIEVPVLDEGRRGRLLCELGLVPEVPLWVAGSTHPGEEEAVLEAYRHLKAQVPGLQLLLAPRDPGRAGPVEAAARGMGFGVRRRTAGAQKGRADVAVLDTLGELSSCYGLGSVAFVGGTLVPAGGHNLLEPAAHGVPVLFGPHVESCSEMARALAACGGGVSVKDQADLTRAVGSLLASRERRRRMGASALDFVQANRGAVARCLQAASEVLHQGGGS